MRKVKIMFVCLGNICRSPLAKAIFQDLANRGKKGEAYELASSGTGGWHIGEDCDKRVREIAEQNGIPIRHKAQQFSARQGESFDLIIAMDQSNARDLKARLDESHHHKIHLLRRFETDASSMDVPDPYYYESMKGFNKVFKIIHKACTGLFNAIESGNLPTGNEAKAPKPTKPKKPPKS